MAANVRHLRAFNMRQRGVKLIDIGKEFGVTKEGARQMIVRGLEIERRMLAADPWDELSARCRNALTRDGCKPTLDAVSERYSLTIFRSNLGVLGIGEKCIAELQTWLERHGKEPLCQSNAPTPRSTER